MYFSVTEYSAPVEAKLMVSNVPVVVNECDASWLPVKRLLAALMNVDSVTFQPLGSRLEVRLLKKPRVPIGAAMFCAVT